MSNKVLHTIFLLKRGTYAQWKKLNPVLWYGEPGFIVDRNTLKIGDGKTKFLDLPAIAGGGGGDLPTEITDPQEGQILIYDSEKDLWRNVDLSDNESLEFLEDHGLSLKGFIEAAPGQMLVKDIEEGIKWIDPISDEKLQEAVERANASAKEAGMYAIQSGNEAIRSENAADEARDVLKEINRKIWFGTREEYNHLEDVYDDAIYCIVDEEM